MAEDRYPRPVSGEIMTAGQPAEARQDEGRLDKGDVADAEFETVERKVSSGPQPRSVGTEPHDALPAGLNVLKSAAGSRMTAARGGPAFWVFGLALAGAAFWVSGGHALIRQKPSSTPVAAIAPGEVFSIVDVTSRIENAGGRLVLFVDGAALNSGGSAGKLPPMEIRVTATDGRVTRYKLGTSARELAAGARFAFSSRLEAPRDGVKSVHVDFTD